MTIPAPLGWPLLAVPDADGRWRYQDLAESVRERLKIILLVRPRELLGHPEFGVGLGEQLGRGDTLETRRALHDRIVDQIQRHEPRVQLDAVEVFSQPASPGRLRIEIHYRLRRTGAQASLGLTMDLGS